jgi:hypothetical protein
MLLLVCLSLYLLLLFTPGSLQRIENEPAGTEIPETQGQLEKRPRHHQHGDTHLAKKYTTDGCTPRTKSNEGISPGPTTSQEPNCLVCHARMFCSPVRHITKASSVSKLINGPDTLEAAPN